MFRAGRTMSPSTATPCPRAAPMRCRRACRIRWVTSRDRSSRSPTRSTTFPLRAPPQACTGATACRTSRSACILRSRCNSRSARPHRETAPANPGPFEEVPHAMIHRLLLSLVLLAVTSDGATPVPPAATARIFMDERAGTLVLDLAPIDLPANTPHHALAQPPVATLEIPENGFIYGFRVQVVDSAGHALPDELIHHFNLIDPDHRELFLPISRRLLAAGHETGAIRLPRLLFGLPLQRGEHVVASAMVENLTSATYAGARVRLAMNFIPAGRPWPLFTASPWQMDVAFPVGDKSFALPPGRSSRFYEGSPAVPGRIVGLGGHMHDYGSVIEFADVTTGEVIYRAAPRVDSTGHIESIPIAMLYGLTRLGVHIVPEHRYRIAVSYDNPTGVPIPDGGMGVVGGLFVPDHGVSWPAADPGDSLYQQDYRHYMRLEEGGGHHMMSMPMKMTAHEHPSHARH